MATAAKDRVRKYREKREGRSLSVWLNPAAARKFKNIKTLTGATNDAIIGRVIDEAYDSIFFSHCHQVIAEINSQLDQDHPDHSRLTPLYKQLIAILKLDYPSAPQIKDAMNSFKVPNYSGKIGTWKVSQVRKLL
ncbi:hypothetical protein DSCO28_73430 (plasmid) [Desulfosarcina ovata subsp. sediminis]|uniref:Uncharacterized protein n=1 Tax=Desulfosarcina ovata subsp. sediminis TaxID=885957 RepID=A0A5K8A2Q6_9BACT|nr:hypothetical protein [Desulfosarcina ovata]BBO86777.1 hypothetical protein DSCO28_73430 [Desulfosarcina ovata subsp. sediminis]